MFHWWGRVIRIELLQILLPHLLLLLKIVLSCFNIHWTLKGAKLFLSLSRNYREHFSQVGQRRQLLVLHNATISWVSLDNQFWLSIFEDCSVRDPELTSQNPLCLREEMINEPLEGTRLKDDLMCPSTLLLTYNMIVEETKDLLVCRVLNSVNSLACQLIKLILTPEAFNLLTLRQQIVKTSLT